jgi:carbon storage regulator
MLVLSRKKKEALLIGEDIKITVISIEGDKVKLGIEAPENLSIYREEIYEAIKAENKEAATVDPDVLQELLNLPEK